ncbi:MAG: hypothetical protein HPY46_08950 [Candidatus Aminicenantes bacterium]|nr:hypothetical protein [Candidatus Aminicenantes bacterium]
MVDPLIIKKEDGGKGLAMGRGGDKFFPLKVAEKSFDFWHAHFVWKMLGLALFQSGLALTGEFIECWRLCSSVLQICAATFTR